MTKNIKGCSDRLMSTSEWIALCMLRERSVTNAGQEESSVNFRIPTENRALGVQAFGRKPYKQDRCNLHVDDSPRAYRLDCESTRQTEVIL